MRFLWERRMLRKLVVVCLAVLIALQGSGVWAAENEAAAYEEPDVYVSDLEWVSEQTYWSGTKRDRSLDGHTLTVAGQSYAKGLGSHADSKIVYALSPKYERFVSIVGLDDEVKSNPDHVKAKAMFIVQVDGVELVRSPELGMDETFTFDVDLPEGATTLTLVTEDVGDPTCDHTNWLQAGFLLGEDGGGGENGTLTDPVAIASPDDIVKATVGLLGDRLAYEMKFLDTSVMESASLGVVVEGVDLGRGVALGEPARSEPEPVSYSWLGNHSLATDHHTLTKIPVTHLATGYAYTLEVKAFDDGIAFRYVLPSTGPAPRGVSGESTSFRLPEGSSVWYHSNIVSYEAQYTKKNVSEVPIGTIVAPPMTIRLPGGAGYAAITEGALVEYAGMSLRSAGNRTFQANFRNGGPWSLSGDIVTPWRIVSVAADLNGLVNSDIVPNTAPALSPIFNETGTDWIKPGATTWSWLGGGGVTPENMRTYIDFAAELGIPYNLVDEGWDTWGSGDRSDEDVLKEVVDYGKSKGVETWVWKSASDRNGIPGIFDRANRLAFFQKMSDIGVVGVKLDFIDGEELFKMNFYREALEDAARYKLMVNFHGSNKPTGLSRTYPNEVSREGVFGLEQGALSAQHKTTLPFTRYLAGHGDYTPLSFGSRLGSSTWSHQIASAITFTSPSLVYGEHPEYMLNNPAVELLKSIPSVWDETIVLPESEIGVMSAFARRSGSTWYIAVMNGDEANARNVSIPLTFLGDGPYLASIYADHAEKNAGYDIRNATISKQDVLDVSMRAHGGYVAKLSKFEMKPHGGGFLQTRRVTLETAGVDSVIRYTLDGSDPTDRSPVYNSFIELTDSAMLRAKIVSGDGAGTEVSAKFNRTTPYMQIVYDGERNIVRNGGKVTFRTNAEDSNYAIRYTTDGTEPNETSPLYEGPFILPGATVTLKAKLFVDGYPPSRVFEKTLYSYESIKPDPPAPDVYLHELEWISATSGWTPPKKNLSVDGNPLSIAGVRYDYGIGTHANSDIVYDIPDGAKRFVSTIGIDDEVVENGGYASILFSIYADDALLAESPLMVKGQPWHFNVDLPEGVLRLRLSINDYDGKNFDHGDWVNAGFLFEAEAEPGVSAFTGPDFIESGQSFELTYVLTGFGEQDAFAHIAAHEATIRYDAQALVYEGAQSVHGTDTNIVLESEVEAGVVRLIVASEGEGTPAEGDWLMLRFTARETGVDVNAAVAVEGITITDTSGRKTAIDGSSHTVAITGKIKPIVKIESIVIRSADGDNRIREKGGTLQLTASVAPEDATHKRVIWSIEHGANRASIDANGRLTATANGSVTVKATAADGSRAYGTFHVVVTGQQGGGRS